MSTCTFSTVRDSWHNEDVLLVKQGRNIALPQNDLTGTSTVPQVGQGTSLSVPSANSNFISRETIERIGPTGGNDNLLSWRFIENNATVSFLVCPTSNAGFQVDCSNLSGDPNLESCGNKEDGGS